MEDEGGVEFWEARYRAGKIPWDYGGVPSELRHFLEENKGPVRVLVPGCGSGHEIRAFAEAGCDVIGLDFSPAAVERAKNALDHLEPRVVIGDFFSYPLQAGSFDWIYERTFLCALPVTRRKAYVSRVTELLKPEGMLFGYFFHGEEADPPPNPLGSGEAQELFGPFFHLEESRPSRAPLPLFEGRERWEVWRKI